MATKNELDERLNSPMRIFIGGKFIGESDSDTDEEPAKDRLRKIVDKRKEK